MICVVTADKFPKETKWFDEYLELTGWLCEFEDLVLECGETDKEARLAHALAWTRAMACIRRSMSELCFLTMRPLTSAWSFTNPLSALSALLAYISTTITNRAKKKL